MRQRILASLTVALVMLGAGPLAADWEENFNGGTYQQSWTWGSVLANGDLGAGREQIQNDALEIFDGTATLTSAVSGFGFVAGESFSNVRVTATLNPGGDNDMYDDVGLLARINPTNLLGYALTVDFGGTLDLSIIEVDGDDNLAPRNLASSPFDVEPTDSLYMVFTLGDKIIGQVFDQPGGEQLARVESLDTTYSEGVSGVIVNRGNLNSPLRGTFDDVASEVPEPTSLALFGIAGLLSLCFWRRSRRAAS